MFATLRRDLFFLICFGTFVYHVVNLDGDEVWNPYFANHSASICFSGIYGFIRMTLTIRLDYKTSLYYKERVGIFRAQGR